jgi:hypothetical protein
MLESQGSIDDEWDDRRLARLRDLRASASDEAPHVLVARRRSVKDTRLDDQRTPDGGHRGVAPGELFKKADSRLVEAGRRYRHTLDSDVRRLRRSHKA